MPEREKLGSRLKHAWNIFFNRDSPDEFTYTADIGPASSMRPDKPFSRQSDERTIITAIKNRIAIDVSRTTIQHVRLDKNNRFSEVLKTGLNDCLTVEANVDQSAQQFKHDIVFSMLDEGYVAVVPTKTKDNLLKNETVDILSMRVARIVEWYPQHVRVEMYNEVTTQKQLYLLPKSKVLILENPFYAVMNEPNSTLKRLVRKMALLDKVDEQSSSGKLDLIVQLPYSIKTEARQQQAEMRRKAITDQLTDGYGIGYIDSTEHVTQLNRPVENSLPEQIRTLQDDLFNQLGMTRSILDGSASDQEQTNYFNQTIEPIVAMITGEMIRKWLTKTARSQGQTIYYFKDPFKFIPVTNLANIADVMTRNAIMSSNEFRQILGMKASDSPDADALRNKNMPTSMEPNGELVGMTPDAPSAEVPPEEEADTRLTADTPISLLGGGDSMAASDKDDENIVIHSIFDAEPRGPDQNKRDGPYFVIKRQLSKPGTGG